jgi:hypothetical protein
MKIEFKCNGDQDIHILCEEKLTLQDLNNECLIINVSLLRSPYRCKWSNPGFPQSSSKPSVSTTALFKKLHNLQVIFLHVVLTHNLDSIFTDAEHLLLHYNTHSLLTRLLRQYKVSWNVTDKHISVSEFFKWLLTFTWFFRLCIWKKYGKDMSRD